MSRPAEPSLIGKNIAGKFVVESFIGGGAMGAVYRARQLSLDKLIALKVLHQELVTDATFTARFEREARAASRLDHPNSMRVLDYGQEPDGLCYIAMELLEGRTLFQLLREDGPLSDVRIVELMRQALAALAVAHDMGIVHRDLKPENIVVLHSTDDEGQTSELVKVCDFGMAKMMVRKDAEVGAEKLTSHGVVVGTPEYMSPEQGRGDALDARSDLYAVGVILYQLLTGRLPFQAETPIGILLKHLTEEPVPVSRLIPGVNPLLEALCLKALRKQPEERPASARDMRAELRAAIDSQSLPKISPGGRAPLAPDGVSVPTANARVEPAQLLPVVEAATPMPLGLAAGSAAPTTERGVAIVDRRKMRAFRAVDMLQSVPPPQPAQRLLTVTIVLALLGGVVGGVVLFKRQRAATGMAHADKESTAVVGPALSPVAPQVTGSSASPIPSSAPSAASMASSPVAPAVPPSSSARALVRGVTSAASKTPSPPAGVNAPPAEPVAPPPVTLSTPPPSPPPPTPATPTPPAPFENVRVLVGAIKVDHAAGTDVLNALPVARFTQCYRDGLRARGSPVSGAGKLHLTLASDGHVSEASFSTTTEALGPIGQCIATSSTGHIVHNVEVGVSGADVDLSFRGE
jgi:tRNA A-37 threonylcarbamoyl transferase component Bud32